MGIWSSLVRLAGNSGTALPSAGDPGSLFQPPSLSKRTLKSRLPQVVEDECKDSSLPLSFPPLSSPLLPSPPLSSPPLSSPLLPSPPLPLLSSPPLSSPPSPSLSSPPLPSPLLPSPPLSSLLLHFTLLSSQQVNPSMFPCYVRSRFVLDCLKLLEFSSASKKTCGRSCPVPHPLKTTNLVCFNSCSVQPPGRPPLRLCSAEMNWRCVNYIQLFYVDSLCYIMLCYVTLSYVLYYRQRLFPSASI